MFCWGLCAFLQGPAAQGLRFCLFHQGSVSFSVPFSPKAKSSSTVRQKILLAVRNLQCSYLLHQEMNVMVMKCSLVWWMHWSTRAACIQEFGDSSSSSVLFSATLAGSCHSWLYLLIFIDMAVIESDCFSNLLWYSVMLCSVTCYI